MRKTYNVVTNAEHGEALFIIGRALGERLRTDESLIIVYRHEDGLPNILQGAQDVPLIEDLRLAVLTGVGGVEEAVEFYEPQGRIHVMFYMPGFCKHADNVCDQNQLINLPVRIVSDTVRRICNDPRVTTITLFVDKEEENV